MRQYEAPETLRRGISDGKFAAVENLRKKKGEQPGGKLTLNQLQRFAARVM